MIVENKSKINKKVFNFFDLISNIKEHINIKIGISTKIIYLSIKIGCLIKLYVRGRKYEKNNIRSKKKYLLENLNTVFL